MRLRQIALTAWDLETETKALTETLGIEVAYRDPEVDAFGLNNIVAPAGGEFIEIVSPKPDATNTAAGRYMERRGGDSGYMVIFHSEDAVAERARIADLGIRMIWKTDRPEHTAGQFHPRDLGGVLTSIETHPGLADIHETMCPWPPAGNDWRDHVATDRVTGVIGCEIQADDTAAVAARWGAMVQSEVENPETNLWKLKVGNAEIRFVPVTDPRGAGLAAVDLATADRAAIVASAKALGLPANDDQVTICGTIFNLK